MQSNLKSDKLEEIFSYLIVFQLFLGVLQLLGFIPSFNVATRRTIILMEFTIGFNLVPIMTLLTILWSLYITKTYGNKYLIALIPILLGLLNPEIALALTSILMFIIGFIKIGNRDRPIKIGLVSLSIIYGLAALHYSILVPLFGGSILADLSVFIFKIYYLSGNISPLLATGFLFWWILKPLISQFYKIPELNIEKRGPSRLSQVILIFSLILSIISVAYPYLGYINPEHIDFGVDYQQYVDGLTRILKEGSSLTDIRQGSIRLLYVLFIFVQKALNLDIESTVRFFPAILNPLLILSTYYFTNEVFENAEVAAWSSFFTSTGFTVTVGMYSYFLANNLGLSVALGSLGLLFNYLKNKRTISIVLSLLLGVILVFTHPWTMNQYIVPIAPLIVHGWFKKKEENKEELASLTLYFLVILSTEIIRLLVLGGSDGIGGATSVTSRLVDITEYWYTSLFSFKFLYNGYLSNIIFILLATIGIILFTPNNTAKKYLTSSLFFSSIVYLFTNEIIKSRIFYNIPLALYASTIIYFINCDKKLSHILYFVISYQIFYLFMALITLM